MNSMHGAITRISELGLNADPGIQEVTSWSRFSTKNLINPQHHKKAAIYRYHKEKA